MREARQVMQVIQVMKVMNGLLLMERLRFGKQNIGRMPRSYPLLALMGLFSLTAFVGLGLMIMMLMSGTAHAERVKDLATVAGVRGNQLVGYGLVVGLDGTGDQTSQAPFTIQSIRNMLAKFGVTIPANVNPQLKNVAAVTVNGFGGRVFEPAPGRWAWIGLEIGI